MSAGHPHLHPHPGRAGARANQRISFPALALLMACLFLWGGLLRGQTGPAAKGTTDKNAANGAPGDDAKALKDFAKRVQEYVKLHKKVEATIPALKPTDVPELIAAHQQALARKLREARPQAQAGEIFTPEVTDTFRRIIREVLQSSPADRARTPLGRTDAPQPLHLQVNGVYPDAIPYEGVSPVLLAKLPQLPPEVAYRVVLRDLLLIDKKANMVVDMGHEMFPPRP